MRKLWMDDAWASYVKMQTGDKRLLKRVNDLLRDIERDPYCGTGKPEALRGDLSGWYSRRIDSMNRLVYRIADNVLEIMQCGTHYKDK